MNHRIPRLALAGLLLWVTAARAEIYTVPLLVSSTVSGGPQGVVRIVNGTDGSGTVTVHAIDDAGVRHGPATFTLSASAAVEFTAGDLVAGNAAKGLSGGIGRRSGDMRLEIVTDLDIVPLAFVRAPDGALSAMHDTVRMGSLSAGWHTYDVPTFNPSTDVTQASRLRLINPGEASAEVTIKGRDDGGADATGGDVTLTLPAGGARTLTALQLEAGGAGLAGRLGAGTGRWRLTVAADAPLEVVNVVTAPAGYWSNLSTTAAPGAAPANRAAFDARFLDRAIIGRAGGERSAFRIQPGGRFTETDESDGVVETYAGDYGYGRIGPDAGRLEARYDDGEVCAANLYFSTRMAGWFASRCTDAGTTEAYWSGGSWSVGDPGEPGGGGPSYGAGDTVATLPAGSWTPDITSGGSFSLSGGDVTVRLDSGGYIEEGGYRYTCQSAGGCEVVNRRVRTGMIAQTAAGTPPGDPAAARRNVAGFRPGQRPRRPVLRGGHGHRRPDAARGQRRRRHADVQPASGGARAELRRRHAPAHRHAERGGELHRHVHGNRRRRRHRFADFHYRRHRPELGPGGAGGAVRGHGRAELAQQRQLAQRSSDWTVGWGLDQRTRPR